MRTPVNFIVVYLTDGGDLYSDEFQTLKSAKKFIENNEEYKAILVKGKNLETEDFT